MWELFSRKTKITAVSVLSVIFIMLYLVTGMAWPSVDDVITGAFGFSKIVSYLSFYWLAMYFFLKFVGMSIWKIPMLGGFLNKHVGPDLRGKWKSTIQYRGADGLLYSKELVFFIEMSIFEFSMNMDAADNYSSSRVVSSRLLKDELLGGFVLYYVFESEVNNPVSTDVSVFQGAAKLRIDSSGGLKGVYWTNRNWQNSMQTAGFISLVKES